MQQSFDSIREHLAKVPDPVRLLEGIFAYAPVGLQIFRPDGHCLLTNEAFRELFGSHPPPEYNILEDNIAAERGILDLIHRAFAGKTVDIAPVWYDARELEHVDVQDAKRVAVGCTIFPLPDSTGAVAYVALVFNDGTAEMVAREKAEEAARQAEESRAVLDTLLQSAPVGLGFLDRELRYVRVNDQLAAINGARSPWR